MDLKKVIGVIEYDEQNNCLKLLNYGDIQPRHLDLGGGNKEQDLSKIGQFGEGMKLTALVFVRPQERQQTPGDGPPPQKTFQIKTTNEQKKLRQWRFFMQDNQLTGGNTLHLEQKIEDRSDSQEPQVEVKIENVNLEEYKEWCEYVLPLAQQYNKVIVDDIGEMLIEPKHLGKLYVRGIFILDLNKTKKFQYEMLDRQKARYGYNIVDPQFQLDRDRNCVPNQTELFHLTSQMHALIGDNYQQTLGRQPILADANFFQVNYQMLAINNDYTSFVYQKCVDKGNYAKMVFQIFQSRVGNYWPVYPSPSHVKRITDFLKQNGLQKEFYPFNTNISSEVYHNIVKAPQYKTINTKYKEITDNVTEEYNQLTDPERQLKESVVALIRKTNSKTRYTNDNIKFKEFPEYNMTQKLNNTIYLSKKRLSQVETINFIRQFRDNNYVEQGNEAKIQICKTLMEIEEISIENILNTVDLL